MPTDRPTEVLFPAKGLNVATAYGQQPKGTTADGVNVRAYESLAERGRGGSRSGLSKYLAATVPAGAHLIQHMNLIVDPQSPALLAGGDVSGATFPDPDPRWGGRLVRVGGDAIQMNRNVSRQAAVEIEFVQEVDDNNGGGATLSLTLAATPAANQVILAFVLTQGDGAGAEVDVTNSAAQGYTQVGTYAEQANESGSVQTWSLSVWYRVAGGTATDATATVGLTVDPGNPTIYCGLLVYKNVNQASPVSAHATKSLALGVNTTTSVGPVGAAEGGAYVVATGGGCGAGVVTTPTTTQRVFETSFLQVRDRYPLSAGNYSVTGQFPGDNRVLGQNLVMVTLNKA